MRSILLTVLILHFILKLTYAQTDEKIWNLQECIEFAIQNNLDLRNQTLNLDILHNNYQQSKYDLLPNLNASSSFSNSFGQTFSEDQVKFVDERVTSFNIGIFTSVQLFEGLRKYHTINRNLLEKENGQTRYEILKNQITLEIVNTYLQIIYNSEHTKIIEEQLLITEQQIEKTKKLIQSGSIPSGDLYTLLSQKADEASQIITYKNLTKQATLSLTQAMNLNSTGVEIFRPQIDSLHLMESLPPVIDSIYSDALNFMPELKYAEIQQQLLHKDMKITKSGYYPSLSLSAGFSGNYNNLAVDLATGSQDYPFFDQLGDKRQAQISLNLSIPIFSKFNNRTNVQNIKINIEQADNDILRTKQDIYKVIQSAYNDVIASVENMNARQQAVFASEESFRYAEQRYNAGAIGVIDYNLEKNKLNQAKSKLLQSKFDLLVKIKILEFYRGIELKL